jgi:hypothetical protein
MKQTAVEWLHKLSKQRELDKFDWEQAKEMEKQHKYTEEDMYNCWQASFTDAMNCSNKDYKPFWFKDFINSLNKQN